MRRLLVISHTPHHRRDGDVVGWGPTVRELDHLANRFATVRHIACLYDGPAPATAVAYAAENVEVVPVPPAGGNGLRGKLGVLRVSSSYVHIIERELKQADVVHVRAPANIAMLAMLVLQVRRHPTARWFKYAGNWMPDQVDHATYAFQRWWLRHVRHGGIVTVAGRWPDQPAFVHSFQNPSLDDAQLARGQIVAAGKKLVDRVNLVFVGSLTASKGAARAIEVIAELHRRRVDAHLVLVGDGPERNTCMRLIAHHSLSGAVDLRGWQSPAMVHAAYEGAHIQLLPSATEGWPKVLSEGMAYGVVPIAHDVSGIRQQLDEFGCGRVVRSLSPARFADEVARYLADPLRWKAESERAVAAARLFSYAHYQLRVDELLDALRADS